MLIDWSTTWLLVRTSPDDVLIIPLWLVDGVTAEIGAVELDGSELCGALATGVWLEECRYRAMVRPMPTPKAPAKMVAAMVPAASQRPQAGRGAGAGGR